MKKAVLHPFFCGGLILRLLLFVLITPHTPATLYIPFLETSVHAFHPDPWQNWVSGGGALAAFPYGYAMWLAFLPFSALFKAVGLPLIHAYALTILCADIALLILLGKLSGWQRPRLLLLSYWLSPIVIVASYMLGYNDLIPAAFLVAALLAFKNSRDRWAGTLLVTAVSAKIAMIMAAPFFLIYLWRNRSQRFRLPLFLQGTAVGMMLFILPFYFSVAGMHMLFANPEIRKAFAFSLSFGNVEVYFLPLAYLVFLYMVWRIKRLNFSLLVATLGVAFMLAVLTTHALPGWFCWAIPFLVLWQLSSDRIALAATGVFSLLYLADTSLGILSQTGFFHTMQNRTILPALLSGAKPASLIHTVLLAVGIILLVRMWRETVSRNHYFRMSHKPIAIGVAGDSGAGKDTFSSALAGLFGLQSVAALSGDDYHLWDRQAPGWKALTHLNPAANDLNRYMRDLMTLLGGNDIVARHYDHQTGRMSRPHVVKSRDIVIASGLHALYLPDLRTLYDIRVYLAMDENLRRHLKIQRDVRERGHTPEAVLSSFDRREPDAAQFIRPQKAYADIVFSVAAHNPDDLKHKGSLRYVLGVTARTGANETVLSRWLMGAAGLQMDMASESAEGTITYTVSGDISAEDVALIAQKNCPRSMDFLDRLPQWQNGVLGLMQLITLFHLECVLERRLIQ